MHPSHLKNGHRDVPIDRERRHQPRNEFIASEDTLPSDEVNERFKRLLIDPVLRLALIQAFFIQRMAALKGMREIVGLLGMMLLCGPPGTGKSTAARGIPDLVMRRIKGKARLLVVNAHALPGSERGACQKNIARLFELLDELARALTAAGTHLIVVIDELETLATSREHLSSATNPMDTAFAVNALLEALDKLMRAHRNVFIIATTNLPDSIDSAVFDRFDDVFELPLPADAYRLLIIAQSLEILQPGNCNATALRRAARSLLKNERSAADVSDSEHDAFAACEALIKATTGFSPRRLSRLPVQSLSARKENIESPITLTHLTNAARRTRRAS